MIGRGVYGLYKVDGGMLGEGVEEVEEKLGGWLWGEREVE